jgi:pentatricopeptide repeat protein
MSKRAYYLRKEKDYKKAIEIWNKMLEMGYVTPFIYGELFELYSISKQSDMALISIKQACRYDKSYYSLLADEYGYRLMYKKEVRARLVAANFASKLKKYDIAATQYYSVASYYIKTANNDKVIRYLLKSAQQHFKCISQNNTSMPEAFYHRGITELLKTISEYLRNTHRVDLKLECKEFEEIYSKSIFTIHLVK